MNHSTSLFYGQWISASFKSILWVCFYVAIFTYYEIQIPLTAENWDSYGFVFALFLGTYIVLSLIGWIGIGLPTHWLICKLRYRAFYIYPLSAVLMSTAAAIFIGIDNAIFIGIAAVLQAILFRVYVFRKTFNTSENL